MYYVQLGSHASTYFTRIVGTPTTIHIILYSIADESSWFRVLHREPLCCVIAFVCAHSAFKHTYFVRTVLFQ
jgi:hypothetical protein